MASIDLQDKARRKLSEYQRDLSEEVSRMIDQQITFTVLQHAGWTTVTVSDDNWYSVQLENSKFEEWIKQNCTGKYMQHIDKFVFENESDATAFALRWA